MRPDAVRRRSVVRGGLRDPDRPAGGRRHHQLVVHRAGRRPRRRRRSGGSGMDVLRAGGGDGRPREAGRHRVRPERPRRHRCERSDGPRLSEPRPARCGGVRDLGGERGGRCGTSRRGFSTFRSRRWWGGSVTRCRCTGAAGSRRTTTTPPAGSSSAGSATGESVERRSRSVSRGGRTKPATCTVWRWHGRSSANDVEAVRRHERGLLPQAQSRPPGPDDVRRLRR